MTHALVTLGLADPEVPEPQAGEEAGRISGLAPPAPSRPGGLAVSLLLHVLAAVVVLETAALVQAPSTPTPIAPSEPRPDPVFLPEPAVLRKILGLRPPPPAVPKDRISIGPRAPARSPEPLVLHRDDDLTAVAKGTSAPPTLPPQTVGAPDALDGRLATAAGPSKPGPILTALQRLAGGGEGGSFGVPSGAGGQMGPLFFDPEGADFTGWIQRFKNEVYRNWIIPPSAQFGWGGQVEIEFAVDRAGALVGLRLLRSSGTGGLDRAARNALTSSRLLPLPSDYTPATVTMRVVFEYSVRAPR